MKKLHDFIKNEITTQLPAFKRVERYRGQDIAQEARQNDVMLYPACLIQYNVVESRALALGITEQLLDIEFRLYFENYTRTRDDDMIAVEDFTNVIERLRGNPNDNVQFTSMEEQRREQDNNFEQVNNPIVTYRTLYRNLEKYLSDTENNQVVTIDATVSATIQ